MKPGSPKLPAAASSVLFWGVLIALLTLLGLHIAQPGRDGPITNPTDFRAFYCSGRSVLAHADPYRVEPLRSCEAASLTAARLRWVRGMVVPTPQPPYTLALFSLCGLLPFLTASALWFALLVAAWLRTVMLLRDLTGLRILWPALATLVLGLVASSAFGKMMPLTMWLFVEAAAALRNGHERRAVWLVTFATLEPQIGAPVWLALFALRPGARRGLALGAVSLLAVSLLALGPQACLEWLTQVLPAQSMSELRDPEQYSLTSFLVLAGTAPAAAHALGVGDYGLMLALGIWAAGRLESRWRDPAVIALIPPAFVVLGGMYLHENQLAAAIPIGLLALGRTQRAQFVLALVLLAIPWFSFAGNIFPQAGKAYSRTHSTATLPAVRPSDLAEVSWSRYVDAFAPEGQSVAIAALVKLPQWLGVALVVLPLLGLAAARPRPAGALAAAPS